jgi:hypothetical protein
MKSRTSVQNSIEFEQNSPVFKISGVQMARHVGQAGSALGQQPINGGVANLLDKIRNTRYVFVLSEIHFSLAT